MKEKLSKWLIGVHVLDILAYLNINMLLSEHKHAIHILFSFNIYYILFIVIFFRKYPQTRLEGVSANKTGQFAVVLEVDS